MTSHSIINNCTFVNNSARFHGGAVSVFYQSSAEITNCVFKGNSAKRGGAIENGYSNSDISVSNCLFDGNTASEESAFLMNWGRHALISNCTIVNNTSSGGALITNYDEHLKFTNCIFNNNSSPLLWENEEGVGTTTMMFSCIPGGFSGEGNIDTDPLFTDPDNHDFSLQNGSPCIDAGTRDDAPATDITGMGRPQGGLVDMGAYEKMIGGGIFFSN